MQKQYELIMKLRANLGGDFASTFQTAMKTTKELQGSLQRVNKIQGDISGYKKTQEAVDVSRSRVQGLTAEHDKLKQRLTDSTKIVRELEKALDKSAKATGKETEEYKRLETELKKAKEDKSRLSDQTTKTAAAVERASGKVTEQEQKLDGLTKSLHAAGVNTSNLAQENDRLTKVYDRVKKSQEDIARVNARLDKNAAAISATRSELTKTLGGLAAGGAALYGAAIKPAMEFESAFAGVKKTIDGTPQQLLKIQNGIRKMALEIPLGTSEISKIAESAGQLGIKTESILKFTRVMADLGVTSNLEGEEAASTLAKFANITGMSQNNFDRLGSTIVALGNNLATTESDIAAMSLRLAGAGSQVGMSEAQILSFAGALSSVGIEAEAGGSAFSKVMANMQLATETGNKDLAAFARVSGVSAKEFKQAFQRDAAGAINLFIKGLSDSQAKGESAIKVLDDMGITEVRMRDALLRAAGASDVFTESLALGTKAWEKNNALTEEAKQRYATTESSLQIMRQAFNDIGISLGSVFLPQLAETAKRVADVSARFSEFAQNNPQLVKAIVAAAGGFGVVKAGALAGKLGFLEMEKGVLTTVKSLLGFKAKATETIADTATGSGKIASLGKSLSGYFGGVKNALGGVDASMSKFNFAKSLMAKFDAGSLGQVIKGQAGGLFNNLLSPFKAMGGKAGSLLSPIGTNIAGVFGSIANGPLGKVGGVFKSLGGTVGAVLKPLGGLGGMFGGLFGKIMPIIAIVSLLATLFLKLNGGDISGFIKPLMEAFEAAREPLNAVMEQLRALGTGVMEQLAKAAEKLAPLFFEIVAAILPVAVSLLQAVMPIVMMLAQSVLPLLLEALTVLMPPLANLITSIMPVLKTLIDALVPVITGLATVFSVVLATGIKTVLPIIENLIKVFQGIITFISGVFSGDLSKALEGLKGIFSGAFEAIKGVVMGPINFIKDSVTGLINKIKGIGSGKIEANTSTDGSVGVKVAGFAKGTNYTPDTFIAGERGAELITGARGRKVFTAAQTSSIFANINRAKETHASANASLAVQTIPTHSGSVTQSFSIQYSPAIYIDGNKPNDLEERLRESNNTLLNMIEERFRQRADNERRMAYT